MICPVCGGQLRAVDRSGIEIDICPQCKGVWLDRGELEKLLQREAQYAETGPAPAPQLERRDERQYRYEQNDDEDEDDDRRYRQSSEQEYRGQNERNPQRRRRGSWLSDLFEGFGGD